MTGARAGGPRGGAPAGGAESIRALLEETARTELDEGPDKRLGLAEAVRRAVRPGMAIHLAFAGARPFAAINEVARQFWGTAPRFTVYATSIAGNAAVLVHGGLVSRLITGFCGEVFPTPAPSPVVRRAYGSGALRIESWSLLTLVERLRAAATGVGFAPTHSLVGSSMAADNAADVFVGPAPFGSSDPVALVREFRPDLSVVHGIAADRAGNTILAAPYTEGVLGAFAARGGALVTVERFVSTDEIRRNAHLVRLPGHLVRSVSLAPLGAHPYALYSSAPGEGYVEDLAFIIGARSASKDTRTMQEWVDEWVLGCADHDAYVDRLGKTRVARLRAAAAPDAWTAEIPQIVDAVRDAGAATPSEVLVAVAARRLRERIREGGYRTVLLGIGTSNLAGWLAAHRLRDEGVELALMAEIGMYGYRPRPGDPFLFASRNLPTCTMLTDTETILGLLVRGESSRTIGVLGAVQVDRHGNVNTTLLPGGSFVTGSGGANDIASTSREVIVVTTQSADRFVDEVTYVTSPGARVRTVVSDLGVFEKPAGHEELVLAACIPTEGESPRDAVARAKAACGWELRVSPSLAVEPQPTTDELQLMRLFDPQRRFLAEHKGGPSS